MKECSQGHTVVELGFEPWLDVCYTHLCLCCSRLIMVVSVGSFSGKDQAWVFGGGQNAGTIGEGDQ